MTRWHRLEPADAGIFTSSHAYRYPDPPRRPAGAGVGVAGLRPQRGRLGAGRAPVDLDLAPAVRGRDHARGRPAAGRDGAARAVLPLGRGRRLLLLRHRGQPPGHPPLRRGLRGGGRRTRHPADLDDRHRAAAARRPGVHACCARSTSSRSASSAAAPRSTSRSTRNGRSSRREAARLERRRQGEQGAVGAGRRRPAGSRPACRPRPSGRPAPRRAASRARLTTTDQQSVYGACIGSARSSPRRAAGLPLRSVSSGAVVGMVGESSTSHSRSASSACSASRRWTAHASASTAPSGRQRAADLPAPHDLLTGAARCGRSGSSSGTQAAEVMSMYAARPCAASGIETGTSSTPSAATSRVARREPVEDAGLVAAPAQLAHDTDPHLVRRAADWGRRPRARAGPTAPRAAGRRRRPSGPAARPGRARARTARRRASTRARATAPCRPRRTGRPARGSSRRCRCRSTAWPGRRRRPRPTRRCCRRDCGARSHGLRVAPNAEVCVEAPMASSSMLARPSSTAPAVDAPGARPGRRAAPPRRRGRASRWTSSGGGRRCCPSRRTGPRPAARGARPGAACRPGAGPGAAPARRPRGRAPGSPGSRSAIWRRWATTTSSAVSSPRWTSSAIRRADSDVRAYGGGRPSAAGRRRGARPGQPPSRQGGRAVLRTDEDWRDSRGGFPARFRRWRSGRAPARPGCRRGARRRCAGSRVPRGCGPAAVPGCAPTPSRRRGRTSRPAWS